MLDRVYPPHPDRVLVIAAHPDDIEFTVAGAVAKWAREGTEIFYTICTDGDTGSHDLEMPPERLRPVRQAEQRAAAEVLGVKEVVFLGYPDGTVQPTLELRRDLTRMIRRYRPSAVIAWDPTRRYSGNVYLNHPDHIAVGEAALAAIMPACDSPFIFPELLTEGIDPHKVHEVYLYGSEELNVWVDITETMDLKIAALQCHKSQVGGWKELPEALRTAAQSRGEPCGIPYAETFHYFYLD